MEQSKQGSKAKQTLFCRYGVHCGGSGSLFYGYAELESMTKGGGKEFKKIVVGHPRGVRKIQAIIGLQ